MKKDVETILNDTVKKLKEVTGEGYSFMLMAAQNKKVAEHKFMIQTITKFVGSPLHIAAGLISTAEESDSGREVAKAISFLLEKGSIEHVVINDNRETEDPR